MPLPEYQVFDPALESLSESEVRDLQDERLRQQVRHCYDHAPFWRAKFQEAGISPEDIRGVHDLPLVPFSHKAELQADQASYPPYGSYLAVEPAGCRKFFTTSGTTGRPVVRTYNERDWAYVIQRFVRRPFLKPGDVAVLLGPTDGLLGPSAAVESWSAMGALTVRASRFSTEAKIKLIHELRPALVCGTATFLLYLAEKAAAMGMEFTAMGGVPLLLSVGEPGAAIEATRKRMMAAYHSQAVIDGFGITELFPLGGSCPGCADTHVSNDFVIVEVVDPDTGEPLAPGQTGELVYSNIIGETQPLLRYRSRDIGRLAPFGPCPACGSTATRIQGGIVGRVDDMIWFKGINIFPSAVEAVVRDFRGLTSEFQILLEQEGDAQTMTIRVEAASGAELGPRADLKERLAARMLEALEGVRAAIEILPAGTLERSEYKGQRVCDLRLTGVGDG